MSQFIGCSDLCDQAPIQHVASGAEGEAAEATLTEAVDTGTARGMRLLLMFAAAAGNRVTSLQWSDDGVEWFQCDLDLAEALGDTEGKQVVSICVEAEKRYFRVEFQTPNAYTIAAELTGMRHTPSGCCSNDETVEVALDCDEMTLVPAEAVQEAGQQSKQKTVARA